MLAGRLLRSFLLSVFWCGSPSLGVATPITIDTVLIGNPGNIPRSSRGAVAYEFRMATYEVTNAQYSAFLNTVAISDPNELYYSLMGSSPHGGIVRSGTKGNYAYATKPGMENKPVNYVNWLDAARFVNWRHNGQPSGAQDSTTTEDGAYTLIGARGLNSITRNPDARWWLPSEDEWYKSAYHKNDGVTGNYWTYPTASDVAPLAEVPPGGKSANFANAVGTFSDVGAYADARGPYGTYDQGGNAWEWNEETSYAGSINGIPIGAMRGIGGGSFSSELKYLQFPYTKGWFNSPDETIGFRVAAVVLTPEPSTLPLAVLGLIALGYFARRRCGTEREKVGQPERAARSCQLGKAC
ncbi:MAG: formylglycine-generating enzyme family protein [Pirellulales bacterium]|nr:formylglycine-generating enzyme family protein [Pirellulales bacterium]